MRQKAYYTVDEITNNLYTAGSAWMDESGVEYIGLYHQYSTGETYTQPIWSYNNSVKLIKYENVKKIFHMQEVNPLWDPPLF